MSTSILNPRTLPPRTANAMWDYSWLCCHHPGGSFADWDRCFDELLERGFSAVRIDAFPLVISCLSSKEEMVTLPADPNANWGPSPEPFSHKIVEELVGFCRKARERGIWLILSSWGKACLQYPDARGRVSAKPELLADAWERTLNHLADAEVLDSVLYVDLDQEFPYFSPYQPEIKRLGEQADADEDPMIAAGRREGVPGTAWNPAQQAYIRNLWNTAIGTLQMRFPGLRFTNSLTSFIPDVRALQLEVFDVLEIHFWIHGRSFDSRTRFNTDTLKTRAFKDGVAYQKRMDLTLAATGEMLWNKLRNKVRYAREWADEAGVPLTTTEAWGPWWHMDAPGMRWDWLKDWCERGHTVLAREFNLWSSTPWNYAHPYWENWSDVAWYRRVNASFLK